ncbi:hypothetical protein CPJCM30710_26210 [Clostridium polyendosporum]|uniref:MORN repeat variant n=1 Tax=Clostridium polyendosporum TaxID=69208 RepID=A0A919VH23_9CLOT|nr:hypothetical protein [Clostridium polyendosporum]GIM29955.1 hypothetical protein CPJCM30710_26210 [Clostridium polyendosporum]
MKEVTTKYGVLKGIYFIDQYPDGEIRDCTLNELNELKTLYGNLIPQFTDDSERRKRSVSLSFYSNGNLKSISLQNQIELHTSIGTLPAEFISFYEDGSIKRILPLNGNLSGYWTEEDEYNLAKDFELNFSFGKFTKKIIGIQFYENGEPKNITLWPQERVILQSPIGTAVGRIGISLYPDGKLKSFEPYKPISVDTSIGKVIAYDINAIGVNGDINSLKFYNDGEVKALVTSNNKIEVTDKNNNKRVYKPDLKPSLLDEESMDIIPLTIEFYQNKVRFNNSTEHEYDIDQCKFSIETLPLQIGGACSGCSTCSGCGI